MMPNITKILVTLAALLVVLGLAGFLRQGPAVLAPVTKISQPQHPKLIKIRETWPELRAEAVLIQRLKTGEVLYDKNADRRLPMASLTKLMTALLLAELEQPLARIEFSSQAKQAGDIDDNRSSVSAGEGLKAEDVLKMLLISSGNDAAYAAAEQVSGRVFSGGQAAFDENIQRFVNRMNERAQNLRLVNSHFANPTGRDHPENFSTAQDITILSAFIAEHYPELWAISRTRETFVFDAGGRRYGLINTNPLLDEFPAIYGSKTGFDNEAKGALVLLYQLRPEELFSLVILRSPDRFEDGRKAIQWLESSFVLE